jgi:hypothetical protein
VVDKILQALYCRLVFSFGVNFHFAVQKCFL